MHRLQRSAKDKHTVWADTAKYIKSINYLIQTNLLDTTNGNKRAVKISWIINNSVKYPIFLKFRRLVHSTVHAA